ncbi:hypothetical protein GCM10010199_54940 [Dactylosporangium roseum]
MHGDVTPDNVGLTGETAKVIGLGGTGFTGAADSGPADDVHALGALPRRCLPGLPVATPL